MPPLMELRLTMRPGTRGIGARAQQRKKCLGHGQHAENIHLESLPHFLHGGVHQRPARGDACIVDQSGQPIVADGSLHLGNRCRARPIASVTSNSNGVNALPSSFCARMPSASLRTLPNTW